MVYGHLDQDLARIERAVAGNPRPGDPSLETLRGSKAWSGRTGSLSEGRRGPTATPSWSARAVRAAIRNETQAPLHTPEVEAAATMLASPEADTACKGVGR